MLEIPVAGGSLAASRLCDGGEGAPFVLAVHGITASSRNWLVVARELGDEVTLVAVDLRGRGRSSALPPPYGMAAHVRDMVAVLDQLEVERAVLLGHSLGAFIVSAVAAENPQRARAAVLVDGGLPVPGSEGAEPQAFLDAFLGPAVARLRMRFASREEYRDWWRAHPAFAGDAVSDEVIAAFADYDLTGEAPSLRSAVLEDSVRADAADLFALGNAAEKLTIPATILCAERGILDDPSPMQPLPLAERWAAQAPERRRVVPVPGVNHYTIALGAAGARAVADAVRDASAAR